MTGVYAPNDAASRFLRDSGLDPLHISADDWNSEGYLEIQFRSPRKPKFWPGTTIPVLAFQPWPKGFNFKEFCRVTKAP